MRANSYHASFYTSCDCTIVAWSQIDLAWRLISNNMHSHTDVAQQAWGAQFGPIQSTHARTQTAYAARYICAMSSLNRQDQTANWQMRILNSSSVDHTSFFAQWCVNFVFFFPDFSIYLFYCSFSPIYFVLCPILYVDSSRILRKTLLIWPNGIWWFLVFARAWRYIEKSERTYGSSRKPPN